MKTVAGLYPCLKMDLVWPWVLLSVTMELPSILVVLAYMNMMHLYLGFKLEEIFLGTLQVTIMVFLYHCLQMALAWL